MDEATESDVATCKESLQVHALPESEDVAEALAEISAAGLKGVAVGLRAHISDLTHRLAEAEAENGRFAEMLESSVSDWRKLYTEERAERVRIQGILLNDVQAEHQESDEHIKGLDAVIKTQDKTIRDLKSRVAEAEAERDALRERCEKLEAALGEIGGSEERICNYCEGEGNRYADGKAHYYSEHAPTILCPECGGRGRIRDMDSEDMAAVALDALAAYHDAHPPGPARRGRQRRAAARHQGS